MISFKVIKKLFSYPPITGLNNLVIEEVPLFFTQEMRSWIEDVLEKNFNDSIKDLLQHRIRPWSQIFKVNTVRGKSFFFKIPAAEFSSEAQILNIIGSFDSGNTTKIIAQNEANGSFLMAALEGETLREKERRNFDPLPLFDCANRIGEFQKKAREHISYFEKLNVPKWTSNNIIEDCKSLIQKDRFLSNTGLSSKSVVEFRSLLPFVELKLNILSGLDKGMSIEHGDFQDNNIFISEDQVIFMDWADASISIPSFTIATYCHSILLAHPRIPNKPKLLQEILTKYYSKLLGLEYIELHQFHLSLVHTLYPVVCLLKVARLLDLEENLVDKYATTLIDYWIRIILSFSESYCDKSLCNEIV